MPTYKNTGATLIYDEGIRIEAGDTVQTNQWLVSFPANLTKLSDTPMVDPVIYSAKIASPTSYKIPDSVTGNYKLTLFVPTGGEATFKLNSSNGTARVLGPLDKYEIQCGVRTVDSIIFTAVTTAVYLTVEKI